MSRFARTSSMTISSATLALRLWMSPTRAHCQTLPRCKLQTPSVRTFLHCAEAGPGEWRLDLRQRPLAGRGVHADRAQQPRALLDRRGLEQGQGRVSCSRERAHCPVNRHAHLAAREEHWGPHAHKELQSTQIGKATDPMFWVPRTHIISWLFMSF